VSRYRIGRSWGVTVVAETDNQPDRLIATAQTAADAQLVVNALNLMADTFGDPPTEPPPPPPLTAGRDKREVTIQFDRPQGGIFMTTAEKNHRQQITALDNLAQAIRELAQAIREAKCHG